MLKKLNILMIDIVRRYPQFIPIIGVFIVAYNINKKSFEFKSELIFFSSAFIQALSYFILFISIYNYVK